MLFTGFSIDNNIYNGDVEFNYLGTGIYTIEDWITALGGAGDGNDNAWFFADPLLISSVDLNLLPTSPAIDAGADVSLATDFAGNSIYGVPDIGAYEYQPPYTFAANDIPTTGSIRLYSDGQYRVLTATSSSEIADFSVMPGDGSYLATTTQYMDITIDSWLTSGTYNKQWTATSTAGDFKTLATSTIYTIGDLAPSTYYSVYYTKQDEDQVYLDTYLANDSGQISFDYDQGFSAVTFEVEEDTTSPTAFELLSPSNNSYTTQASELTFSWSASSDSESGLAKYQLYLDSTLDTDSISSLVTSIEPTNNLTCGTHTWYLKALDNAGNSTDSNIFNLTRSCGTVVIRGVILVPSLTTPTSSANNNNNQPIIYPSFNS